MTTDVEHHRFTMTITPVTDDEMQRIIDWTRDEFGRGPLIHVIGKQPCGTHVGEAPCEVLQWLRERADRIAAGGDVEKARAEQVAREWAQIPRQVEAIGDLWQAAQRAGSVTALLDEFHRRPGCDVPQPAEPSIDVPGVLDRLKYIEDEVAELREAVEAGDLPGVLKELADVAYVVYGMAWRCNFPLDAAIAEVHRSNMTKTPTPGDGKAIKGPGYSPADMAAVLATGGDN